eukprot:CAMPEP_0119305100 /NCGR_PEP_ID=MMETSP1333-20130426/6175_1 /TAXON_ID=418940 /ORGANISM="Scyphosphaera apsteinii, Strain RCC1455" /LENGTH=280 /DNA_ID=CAMNT_0007308111 /DNA_START=11 /DNA_END=853 /DNA_ORIENTATION=-
MADKKELQQQVVAVKTRWSDQVRLSKASPDSPSYPLPVGIQRTIPRPEGASAIDVDDLVVKLWIDALQVEELPVRAEVLGELPAELRRIIGTRMQTTWKKALMKQSGPGTNWMIDIMLAYAEEHFSDLLLIDSRFVDQYEGVDEGGMTCRRYSIQEAPLEEEEDEDGEDDDDDDDNEESEDDEGGPSELASEEERLRRIKLAEEAEADRVWREERRREAEKLGETVREAQPVSKKQQQALIKEKQEKRQGHRLRKTGSKANKFDAEAAGKKANKKNGLLH